jgi:isoleucyl-tRNA synthetase
MIKEIPTQYDAIEIEKGITRFWEDEGVYEAVRRKSSGKEKFFFVDGPPFVTGAIHLGTAWNKIIKDVILRYKTMQGYDPSRQPGWDMHGLPVEVEVEKELGLRNKKDIEDKIGISKFIERCKGFALYNKREMERQFKDLGIWMDWEKPYMTIESEYIESVWWTLKKAWEKGLLVKDKRVIHWCPRCETALAEHEVRGEYKDAEDPSVFVKFRLKEKDNEYIIVWTTTPWTLPSNLAVCVHPDYEYVRLSVNDECWILAKGLVDVVLSALGMKYEILNFFPGRELEGLRYVHPFIDEMPRQKEFLKEYKWTHSVILGEHVTLDEGTGCVHTAPGHGEEDLEIGRKYGLPAYSPVNQDGKFGEGKYSGSYILDANKEIMDDLRKKGILLKSEIIRHQYPYCWRCKTPLIFRATEQWYLRTSEIRRDILLENMKVTWLPGWVCKRYENAIETCGDWCITKQRYWGTPLPMWQCKNGHISVIGTLEELREKCKNEGDVELEDLHRPYIDAVVLECSICHEDMHHLPDIVDVWVDSGAASWASLGYPRKKDAFEKLWPADFIVEGNDQVSKWFFSQQELSMLVFGTVPYRKVSMHGFVFDAHGDKMSKSVGNVITPGEVIARYGVDALRFYMLSTNALWDDMRFSWEMVENVNRMLNVLWNVCRFPLPYMVLDEFDPKKVSYEEVTPHLRPEDRWILSRCNTLVRDVTEAMDEYELHKATRALQDFILDDLSRWYVRLIRPRTWEETDTKDKIAAYYVIYDVLITLIKILSPFIPFFTERIYQNLVRGVSSSDKSVHLCEWASIKEELNDPELEEEMVIVRQIVEGAKDARQRVRRKLRWPVKRIIVSPKNDLALKAVKDLSRIIKEQSNSKEIIVLNIGEEWKEKGSFAETSFENGNLYVDAQLTDEIESEGYAREIIRRIQQMRKEMDLDVEDEIDVRVGIEDDRIAKFCRLQEGFISREVRARTIGVDVDVTGEYVKEWVVDGVRMRFGISKRIC